MFFDNLLKEIAICINTGAKGINHDIELPSYRGVSRRKEEGVIDMGNNHTFSSCLSSELFPPRQSS